jgi:hypothetical protein
LEKLSGQNVSIRLRQLHDFRNYKVTIDKARTFLGYVPQYGVEDIVDDLYAQRETFGDFNRDEYYNIRVFQKIMQKKSAAATKA